jgi:hypothetical protein
MAAAASKHQEAALPTPQQLRELGSPELSGRSALSRDCSRRAGRAVRKLPGRSSSRPLCGAGKVRRRGLHEQSAHPHDRLPAAARPASARTPRRVKRAAADPLSGYRIADPSLQRDANHDRRLSAGDARDRWGGRDRGRRWRQRVTDYKHPDRDPCDLAHQLRPVEKLPPLGLLRRRLGWSSAQRWRTRSIRSCEPLGLPRMR